MATPATFPSTTAQYSFPMLFAGQAQKEFFINQSLVLIDALLRHSVIDSLATPPGTVSDGDSYRIISGATDDWAGHEDDLAIRIGGVWHFVSPIPGMAVFDQAAGVSLRFNSGWQSAMEPAAPSGGSTIDSEARLALGELIEALRSVGIFEPVA